MKNAKDMHFKSVNFFNNQNTLHANVHLCLKRFIGKILEYIDCCTQLTTVMKMQNILRCCSTLLSHIRLKQSCSKHWAYILPALDKYYKVTKGVKYIQLQRV